MPTDTCELIRARGFAILKTLDGLAEVSAGVKSAWRDRLNLDIDEKYLPGAVWLDGGEDRRVDTYGHAKPEMPHTLMELKPQVLLIEKPTSTIANADMGPLLAAWRVKIIKAIVLDDALLSLLGDGGQIEYLGHATDFEVGASMRGGLQVNFAMTYLFDPEDL
jgi:hypothetical protein